jgi:hypothetical protein
MVQQMHKAASVAVRLLIDGDDEPAHDFAQTASQVAQEVLALGIAAYQRKHPYKVKSTGMKVLEGSDGEDLFGEEQYDEQN